MLFHRKDLLKVSSHTSNFTFPSHLSKDFKAEESTRGPSPAGFIELLKTEDSLGQFCMPAPILGSHGT